MAAKSEPKKERPPALARVNASYERLYSIGGAEMALEAHLELCFHLDKDALHRSPLELIAYAVESELGTLGWTSPARTAELEQAIADLHEELRRER